MQNITRRSGKRVAVAKINPQKYGRLLAKVLPVRINSEEENRRMLLEAKKLIEKGERRTPEEDTLLDLMVSLIQSFEQKFYHFEEPTPLEVLDHLMEARGIRQRDLWHLFGSKGVASEVVNGKRGISKAQAKALAEFFHVSPELFI